MEMSGASHIVPEECSKFLTEQQRRALAQAGYDSRKALLEATESSLRDVLSSTDPSCARAVDKLLHWQNKVRGSWDWVDKALDLVIQVHAFLASAAFVGLSVTTQPPKGCPDERVANATFSIMLTAGYSFSILLGSLLVAIALKIAMHFGRVKARYGGSIARWGLHALYMATGVGVSLLQVAVQTTVMLAVCPKKTGNAYIGGCWAIFSISILIAIFMIKGHEWM